jgi:hypothetical protein
MKACTWSICRLLFCGLLGCCLATPALLKASPRPEEKPTSAQAGPSDEQMWAEVMKLAAPGPNHEMLKSWAGSWKARTKSWMGPGEPQVTEGSVERSVILGGRYLKEEYTGMFNGMPFQGLGLTGYDNISKEFVSTWVDSFGTGIMRSRGRVDSTGKMLTWSATSNDPITKKEVTMKMVNQIVDPATQVFSMYENREGQEVKTMEITYTRK